MAASIGWLILRSLVLRLIAIAALTSLAVGSALGGTLEYRINFTQTFFHQNFGAREIEGSFRIDDSAFGPGYENMSFGLGSIELDWLTDFTVSVNGSPYIFDLEFTRAIGFPSISSIIKTGTDGEVIDIQGALVVPGTLNQVILGRDGREGTYVDINEIDAFSSFPVSRGTYSVERVSSIEVPEPTTFTLFVIGLAGLGFMMRRCQERDWI